MAQLLCCSSISASSQHIQMLSCLCSFTAPCSAMLQSHISVRLSNTPCKVPKMFMEHCTTPDQVLYSAAYPIHCTLQASTHFAPALALTDPRQFPALRRSTMTQTSPPAPADAGHVSYSLEPPITLFHALLQGSAYSAATARTSATEACTQTFAHKNTPKPH
jgi:hypothetical protein